MRRFAPFIAFVLALLAAPAAAGTGETSASRFVSPTLAGVEQSALAAYGPFRVIDDTTAALVGVTDEDSPAAFRAMLGDHPGLATLAFVECPGTYNDIANLALGRMIRAAGLAAWVPEGGSVRSGAVELVLAGTSLKIEDGTTFAVHAWLDEAGYEASDYAADSPENGRYLGYYREMGMSEGRAAAFYAMTNSVPFEQARWLDGAEMRAWVASEPKPQPRHQLPRASRPERLAEPRLAYLDLSLMLN